MLRAKKDLCAALTRTLSRASFHGRLSRAHRCTAVLALQILEDVERLCAKKETHCPRVIMYEVTHMHRSTQEGHHIRLLELGYMLGHPHLSERDRIFVRGNSFNPRVTELANVMPGALRGRIMTRFPDLRLADPTEDA